MKLSSLLVALLLAAPVAAEPAAVDSILEGFSLEDQFGEEHRVDADVKLILFSRDMDGGEFIKEALSEAGSELLKANSAVYIADVSGMPGLVRRLFALPSMRRRGYPMVLDLDGLTTANLPDQEGQATMIFLEQLRITRIEHVISASALLAEVPVSAPSVSEGAPAEAD